MKHFTIGAATIFLTLGLAILFLQPVLGATTTISTLDTDNTIYQIGENITISTSYSANFVEMSGFGNSAIMLLRSPTSGLVEEFSRSSLIAYQVYNDIVTFSLDPADWDPTISSQGYAGLYVFAYDLNGEDYQLVSQNFTIAKAPQNITLSILEPYFNNQTYTLTFLVHNPYTSQYFLPNHMINYQLTYPNGTTDFPTPVVTNTTGYFTCPLDPTISGSGVYELNFLSPSSNHYLPTSVVYQIPVSQDPNIDNRTISQLSVEAPLDTVYYGTESTITVQLHTQNGIGISDQPINVTLKNSSHTLTTFQASTNITGYTNIPFPITYTLGSYTLEYNYPGSAIYRNTSTQAPLTIAPGPQELQHSWTNIKTNLPISFTGTVTNGLQAPLPNQIVILQFPELSLFYQTTTNINGSFQIQLTISTSGQYIYNISLPKPPFYQEFTYNSVLTIDLQTPTSPTYPSSTLYMNRSSHITIPIQYLDETGSLIPDLNVTIATSWMTSSNITTLSGYAVFSVPIDSGLPVGYYILTFTTTQTSEFTATKFNITLVIQEELVPLITVNQVNNESLEIIWSVYDSQTQNVLVQVEIYENTALLLAITDVNQLFTALDLSPGAHFLTFTFIPESPYLITSIAYPLQVLAPINYDFTAPSNQTVYAPIPITMALYDGNQIPLANQILYLTLLNLDDNVTLENLELTFLNSSFTLDLASPYPGNYILLITTEDPQGYYHSLTISHFITITPLSSVLTLDTAQSLRYVYLTVTLKAGAHPVFNQLIQWYLNDSFLGETYTQINGSTTIRVQNNNSGTFIVRSVFAGTENITASTTTLLIALESSYVPSNSFVEYSTIICCIAPLVFMVFRYRKTRHILFPIR